MSIAQVGTKPFLHTYTKNLPAPLIIGSGIFSKLFFPLSFRLYTYYFYLCVSIIQKGNMKRIILITGGQRSGKSSFAENMAHELTSSPVYMATAKVWDDEFRERVRRHRERRGGEWTNIEEEKELSRHDVTGRVVVIDCVTLWCTNFFTDSDAHVSEALEAVKNEFDRFTRQEATFIFVTNEIGLGGVSTNRLQRKFTDLQGWANQYIAAQADEVYLMVSGIPLKIKQTP
ncbi:adenosylcobinamide-phosphate guanylyltransferase [Bacteroides pyogenes JCM 10003]|nr:adenosylcobinamide-phosphate guanylyltransferase [Bacteroides pyogenes JCM 10003]